jgi:hypothetical protein
MTTTNDKRSEARKRFHAAMEQMRDAMGALQAAGDSMIDLVPVQQPSSTVEHTMAQIIDGVRALQNGDRYVSDLAVFEATPEVFEYAKAHGRWEQYSSEHKRDRGVIRFSYDEATFTLHSVQRIGDEMVQLTREQVYELDLKYEREQQEQAARDRAEQERDASVDAVLYGDGLSDDNGQGHRTRSAEEAIARDGVEVPSSFAAEFKEELL